MKDNSTEQKPPTPLAPRGARRRKQAEACERVAMTTLTLYRDRADEADAELQRVIGDALCSLQEGMAHLSARRLREIVMVMRHIASKAERGVFGIGS